MITPKTLNRAVVESLKFPFSKNLLIYNLIIIAVASVVFLSVMPSIFAKFVEIQKQWEEIQQHPFISDDNRSLQEMYNEIEALSKKPNLTDEDKALIAKDKQTTIEKNQDNKQYARLQELKRQLSEMAQWILPVLFITTILYYIASVIRNLDIVCQIGTGNFVDPELRPLRYSKPLLWLKLLGFFILLCIVLVIALVIPALILLEPLIYLLAFALYIVLIIMLPMTILTLINNYSILGSLFPNKWIKTLKKIGKKNYFLVSGILILFAVVTFILNAITNALMLNFSSTSVILPLIIITIYIQFHTMSSFAYLCGYLIYNKKEKFEMLGASDFALASAQALQKDTNLSL